MPTSTTRVAGAAIAALCVVTAARRARALSPSGAAAAWAVGTITVVGGGWATGGALVAFFASSSVLARLARQRTGHAPQKRGSERDAVQVAANGGFAALAALVMAVGGPNRRANAVFHGSLAAAAADTWATETGRWSTKQPRLFLIGKSVRPGTSGGMTVVGTTGSIAGAATIAAIGAMNPALAANERGRSFAALLVAGIAGALADSVLGATVQDVRRCPACGRETELPTHCGSPTTHVHGWRWLDNDAVNAAATVVGALVAAGLDRDAAHRPGFDHDDALVWSRRRRRYTAASPDTRETEQRGAFERPKGTG